MARELTLLVPNFLFLFRALQGDPRVPQSSKLWLGFAAIWIASPIDLIPEFIPIVGPLDDAIVAALVLRHVLKRTDHNVLLEHWRGDPGDAGGHRPFMSAVAVASRVVGIKLT
jgi:uncharacterized membrane protein YkvA (DUF1232 family)